LMESIQEWRNEEHDEKKWYHNWGRVKGNGRRKQRRKWMKKTSEAIKDKNKRFVVSKQLFNYNNKLFKKISNTWQILTVFWQL
jgi:hypothetical protein